MSGRRRAVAPPGLGTALSILLAIPAAGAATLDVRTYGATGDGLRDDLPAVRRAVAAAAAAGGGVVLFPRGTYRWEGTLRVAADDVTLQGEPGAIIQAVRRVQRLIVAQEVARFRILELAFHGIEEGTRDITVQLRACADCEVARCRFDRIGTSTLDVTEGSERCRIAANTIRLSPGHAVMISGWASPADPSRGSTDVEVHDNFVYRPGNTGISVEVDNRRVSVRGNRVIGANRNRQLYSFGIAVFNGTADYEIVGNLVAGTQPVPGTDDTGDGILIGQGENRTPAVRGRIAGNILLDNGHLDAAGALDCARDFCEGNGILIGFAESGPAAIDTLIEDNLIARSGRSGISLAYATGVTIRDNILLQSHNQGIWLQASAPGNRVLDNLVEHSANHGIRVESRGNLVARNRSRANGLSGIFLAPSARENRVAGNLLWDNDRAGFGHAGLFLAADGAAGASFNTLEDNRFEGAPRSGRRQPFDVIIEGPGCRDNRLGASAGDALRVEDRGTGTAPGWPPAGALPAPPPAREGPPILCGAMASAETLVLGPCRSVVIGGDATIRQIRPCGVDGLPRVLHLACGGSATAGVEEADALFLAAPFRCAPGATLTLSCEAGRWHERGRLVDPAGRRPGRGEEEDG